MSSFVANNAVLNAAATPFTPSFEANAPYDVEQHLYDSPANIAHDNQVAISFLTAHNAPAEFWEQAGYEDPRLSGPRVQAAHPGAVLLLDAMEREWEDRIAKLEKRVDLMHLSSDISDTNVTGLIAPTPLASPQSSLHHRQDQGVPLPPSPPWSPAPVRQMVERSQKKKNRKNPMTRSGQRCRPSDKSRQVRMKLKVEVAGLQDRYGVTHTGNIGTMLMDEIAHVNEHIDSHREEIENIEKDVSKLHEWTMLMDDATEKQAADINLLKGEMIMLKDLVQGLIAQTGRMEDDRVHLTCCLSELTREVRDLQRKCQGEEVRVEEEEPMILEQAESPPAQFVVLVKGQLIPINDEVIEIHEEEFYRNVRVVHRDTPCPCGRGLHWGQTQFSGPRHCKYIVRKWKMCLAMTHLVHHKYIQNVQANFLRELPAQEMLSTFMVFLVM
ncbi:hypothetical protein BJ322DRAFT_1105480 [Thelephora terrestris]|uniref:Uncharacterized protein n=1 Tax=Thelephora terrestris TaxID=56493 RepID=A0A9P6HKX2_9AGAM|nr:hypothetical protein BJ322DRAFT_1105480 [Thelephora terrestris]